MNPNYHPAQSSSYVGLLHSKDGSAFNENFPYESFHSSVNFGDSEPIPAFSSQQTQDAPPETPVARAVRRKWNPTDDEVLISGWLNTSKDPIVSNDQKAGTFWNRVAAYYASSPHGREDGEREWVHCKKRWHRINDEINKFCGAYAAAERQQRSGESDTDVLKKAHDIFHSDNGHKFTLEHAWCMLKYEQKWMSLNTPTPGSKRKNTETSTQSSTTKGFVEPESTPQGLVEPERRPEGIKAAKAKRNTLKGKSVAEYAAVWDMKKADLEKKETLSKLGILDSLIALAKVQPLTEAEEAAKNKILAQYF
ncbi:glutathione S-transferase T3-like [Raphanus sativus]|uniref:Glutathione S-transferase T3-like n=1 Tax=Raphanus sativus TaxID=3726 RepID=A0A6J0MER7_RAPSA|nr:glutathione S-transferase T3-like [Raphanus sativus]